MAETPPDPREEDRASERARGDEPPVERPGAEPVRDAPSPDRVREATERLDDVERPDDPDESLTRDEDAGA